MSLSYSSLRKGFFIGYSTILSLIFLFFIIFSQLIINSKIEFFKNNEMRSEKIISLHALDSIVSKELKTIELYFKNNKIPEINYFFDSNNSFNKIFLLDKFEDRISLGGYKIYQDEAKIKYSNILIKKLENLKENLDIHYIKEIKIGNSSYSLYATINYRTNFSKSPENLTFHKIKRIWIKEND